MQQMEIFGIIAGYGPERIIIRFTLPEYRGDITVSGNYNFGKPIAAIEMVKVTFSELMGVIKVTEVEPVYHGGYNQYIPN